MVCSYFHATMAEVRGCEECIAMYYLALHRKSFLTSAADRMKAVTVSDLFITVHPLSARRESDLFQNPIANFKS